MEVKVTTSKQVVIVPNDGKRYIVFRFGWKLPGLPISLIKPGDLCAYPKDKDDITKLAAIRTIEILE